MALTRTTGAGAASASSDERESQRSRSSSSQSPLVRFTATLRSDEYASSGVLRAKSDCERPSVSATEP